MDFALQKLPFADIENAETLSIDDIAEMLGSKPRTATTPEIMCKSLLAGYIPLVSVGDVFEGSHRVGRLPQASRRVTLDGNSDIADLRIGSLIDAPPDWSATAFRVLNRFEYQLGGIQGVEESRCLVFRQGRTEYILPKLAIFRAFYCLSSKLINALCSGPWPHRASELISFKNYESGITTGLCPVSGSWKIVVQDRDLLPIAHVLALLWFDDHARKQAESLYTDSRLQNAALRGADGRSWYASANIPHRLEPLPFLLGLQGFSLRPFRPSRGHENRERFLITSITGSSWSLPDQLIEFEVDGSNAQGEERHPSEGDQPFRRGRASVEGDPNAVGTSVSDPNPNDPTNVFVGNSFEYFNEPKLQRQQKKSSKSYSTASQPYNDGAASLVSGGTPGSAGASPAPADALQRIRARSLQFEFLFRALQELRSTATITSFEPVTTTDSGLGIVRNGFGCWSLLRAKHRRERSLPKRGWEVVHERAAGQPNAAELGLSSRHARCVLILRVHLHFRQIILLEIEPRPQESAYCMVAFEQDHALSPWSVAPALDAIREHEGRFKEADLASAFATVTSNKVVAIRHYYTYKTTDGTKQETATGIRADILERSLLGIPSANLGVCS